LGRRRGRGRELGIDAVRLSPQPEQLNAAIGAFRAALDGAASDAVAELDGKTFRSFVRDAGLGVAVRVRPGGFEPVAPDRRVDVTFTACAADYLLLAARRVDPDTMFFDRRLLIEGDTDAGLRLKNLLDAVELPRWLTGA
jgi:predicted lipid carrier protein YhbT